MKKLICLLLAAAMLLCFCACGGDTVVMTTSQNFTEGQSGTMTGGDADASGSAGGGAGAGTTANNGGTAGGTTGGSGGGTAGGTVTTKGDLKGATIKVVTTSKTNFPTSKGNTLSSKARYEALQQLQKDLNCKLSVQVTTGETINTSLTKAQLAGEKYADVISLPVYDVVGYIGGGSITDLSRISTIDLSKSYMNFADCVTNGKIKGHTYMVLAEGSTFGSNKTVFFNKEILKSIHKSENHIYDLVKSGKWTVQAFHDLAKEAVLDLDGKSGLTPSDRLGMLVVDVNCSSMEAFLAATGAQILKTDANGMNITYNMDSAEIANAIQLANDTYSGVTYGTSSNDQELYNLFMSGHGLFLVTSANMASAICDMDDDYGLVPFPSVSGKSNATIPIWGAPAYAIPSRMSEKDTANAGTFLQAYCEYDATTLPTTYQEFKTRYLRDDQSYENLQLAHKSQEFRVSSILCSVNLWGVHTGTYQIFYGTVQKPNVSITAMVNERKNASITSLKDWLAKIK